MPPSFRVRSCKQNVNTGRVLGPHVTAEVRDGTPTQAMDPHMVVTKGFNLASTWLSACASHQKGGQSKVFRHFRCARALLTSV